MSCCPLVSWSSVVSLRASGVEQGLGQDQVQDRQAPRPVCNQVLRGVQVWVLHSWKDRTPPKGPEVRQEIGRLTDVCGKPQGEAAPGLGGTHLLRTGPLELWSRRRAAGHQLAVEERNLLIQLAGTARVLREKVRRVLLPIDPKQAELLPSQPLLKPEAMALEVT